MRLDFFQNIINICRGKLLYLSGIADKYIAIENQKEVKTLVLGSSHATFYQTDKNEFNLATASQDLYYSYNLYEKYGQNCENIILTYSVFSKGLCLIKTKETELCVLLKEIFGIDYQFKDVAKKKKLCLFEPFYRIQIKKYLKDSTSLKIRIAKSGESQLMNTVEYIKTRALKHHKNYQREQTQLEYIQKFLDKTKENNQKLILILPPVTSLYKEVLPEGKELFEHLFEMCEKYNHVKILDFYTSKIFADEEFFDSDHLNPDGKIKMTEIVRAEILR